MVQKLKNRSCRPEEAQAAAAADVEAAAAAAIELENRVARTAMQPALQHWYCRGYVNANGIIPKVQRDANLKLVANNPEWQTMFGASGQWLGASGRGLTNGYVMITNFINGSLSPIIIELDYSGRFALGGLTYRQLHRQIRQSLELQDKVSLRMCPLRPWYRHIQNSCSVPECMALPATDAQCRHLLGTTIVYFPYVHLT